MPPRIGIGLFALVLVLASTGGCLQSGAVGDVESQPDVKVAIDGVDAEVSLGLGCYWTAHGYVYNSGTENRTDIEVRTSLVHTGTGTIADSKAFGIARLSPGESRAFDLKLDGECGESYRVDATVSADSTVTPVADSG